MRLENEHIRLRAPEPEDLELMYRLENESSEWAVGCTTVPYSRFLLRQYIEQTTGDIYADKQVRLMIERKSDKLVMGCADLVNYEPMHQRAEVGIIIVPEYRGKGYGSMSLDVLCHYALDFLHLHQLVAYIAADNIGSLAMFRSQGFVHGKQLEQWLRNADGGYKDAWLLQRIKSDV